MSAADRIELITIRLRAQRLAADLSASALLRHFKKKAAFVGGRNFTIRPFFTNKSHRQLLTSRQLLAVPPDKAINFLLGKLLIALAR